MIGSTRFQRTFINSMLLCCLGFSFCGCATYHDSSSWYERETCVIDELYRNSRYIQTDGDIRKYALVEDTNLLQAVETLLISYSQKENKSTRIAAGQSLAHFGTTTALAQALKMAKTDSSPEVRGAIWSGICTLLRPQPVGSSQLTPLTLSSDEEEFEKLLIDFSSIQFPLMLGGDARFDYILPPHITSEFIETEIINQFKVDDGAWNESYITRIPFVPFSERTHIRQQTVRKSIAGSLKDNSPLSPRLQQAFEELNRNDDPAISEPASQAVSDILKY